MENGTHSTVSSPSFSSTCVSNTILLNNSTSSLVSTPSKNKINPFLLNLYDILSNKDNYPYIAWSNDGTAIFLINEKKFGHLLLPSLMKSHNMNSFLRIMSGHGFSRRTIYISKETGEEVQRMVHNKVVNNNSSSSSSSSSSLSNTSNKQELFAVLSSSSSSSTTSSESNTGEDNGELYRVLEFRNEYFHRDKPELLPFASSQENTASTVNTTGHRTVPFSSDHDNENDPPPYRTKPHRMTQKHAFPPSSLFSTAMTTRSRDQANNTKNNRPSYPSFLPVTSPFLYHHHYPSVNIPNYPLRSSPYMHPTPIMGHNRPPNHTELFSPPPVTRTLPVSKPLPISFSSLTKYGDANQLRSNRNTSIDPNSMNSKSPFQYYPCTLIRSTMNHGSYGSTALPTSDNNNGMDTTSPLAMDMLLPMTTAPLRDSTLHETSCFISTATSSCPAPLPYDMEETVSSINVPSNTVEQIVSSRSRSIYSTASTSIEFDGIGSTSSSIVKNPFLPSFQPSNNDPLQLLSYLPSLPPPQYRMANTVHTVMTNEKTNRGGTWSPMSTNTSSFDFVGPCSGSIGSTVDGAGIITTPLHNVYPSGSLTMLMTGTTEIEPSLPTLTDTSEAWAAPLPPPPMNSPTTTVNVDTLSDTGSPNAPYSTTHIFPDDNSLYEGDYNDSPIDTVSFITGSCKASSP